MNQLNPSSLSAARDAMQARFARRVVARLSDGAGDLGGDVTERLRFGRERALERAALARKTAASSSPVGVTGGGGALLGGGTGWWLRAASVLPLVALLVGLVLIQRWQTTAQISVAAEVDAALLADDLPPTAYRDAGFVEFLKTPPRE
jgi:uncharacterized membrane protein (Fun14 family)